MQKPSLRWMLLLAVVAVLLGACAWGRSAWHFVEAGMLLADIASDRRPDDPEGQPSAVVRRKVAFQQEGRQRRADLYLPAEEVRAGLVLLPGVAELGGDDPRLVAFARAMARARFAVLVPELAGLRQLRVSGGDVTEVRDAFAWLVQQPELAPSGRAGLAAFSYAAGPAILAALDAKIRDQVGFVFAVGPYYDLRRVMAYFTTGRYRFDDLTGFPPPDAYGKWAFVEGNIDRLDDVYDRRLLATLAQRLRHAPDAVTDDLVERLHPEGRALWAFVTNRDPQRVPALLAALPDTIRRELAALDLARHDLRKLRAPLILVHGYEDAMIPYPESIALARAVPEGLARLYLVHGLLHVDVEPGLPDRWRLVLALRDLLAARDGDLAL